MAINNILSEIVANKRREIESAGYFHVLEKVLESIPHVKESATCEGPGVIARPDFGKALLSVPVGLIAEVKRKSPSAGPIREPFDPSAIAYCYEIAGAQAVSCLMDRDYFGGGEAQWAAVRQATHLPMLYKEFVIDPRQIFHAEALGASAVLLIAAILDDPQLGDLIRLAEASGMTPLVEVHTTEEFERAVAAGAVWMGVNNRNLKTFETDIGVSLEIARLAPDDCLLVSESGIRTAEDVYKLQDAGFRAVLVGESLLRQPDLREAVRHLMQRVDGSPAGEESSTEVF